ncbi:MULTISPECIES: hypothetical protein [unclassified Sphingomonas]|uniref:hypothetical protein n=1 Tax=unclassified Sphingomonas TaxID=196159 RepID=UPI001F57799F|nr:MULTISPECIES: hypothetical protein [unclassified Sphingomonas]
MIVLSLLASPAKAGAQSWNGNFSQAVPASVGHPDWAPAFAGEVLKVAREVQKEAQKGMRTA